jgi:peptidoglycan-N-acetylglucosamine deacetylase
VGIGTIIKQAAARAMPTRVVRHGRRAADAPLYLTFDDGPHPEHTEPLLELLERFNAKATFFVSGSEVEKYPSVLQSIHRHGHQVANHGFFHSNARNVSPADFVNEIDRSHKVISACLGFEPAKDFRPPYGAITPRSFLAVLERGYRFIFWTRDSGDAKASDAAQIVGNFQSEPYAPGDIVLMHDDYQRTIGALDSILATLVKEQHRFERVDSIPSRSRDVGVALRK